MQKSHYDTPNWVFTHILFVVHVELGIVALCLFQIASLYNTQIFPVKSSFFWEKCISFYHLTKIFFGIQRSSIV